MSKVLQLHNIRKAFIQGEETLEVLKGINLALEKGKVVALLGASGSGKTTLLQIAGLLSSPSSGEVWLEDRDASKAGDAERTQWRREKIGFIYQFHHLLPEFTALENVMLPQLIGGKGKAKAETKAKELLAELGLSERLTHRPSELSGGEQQRVAIARALANDPALILADEPTGNLDADTAEKVFQLLMSAVKERGLTALIATHNTELAKRMHRLIRLESGKLVQP